MVQHLNRAVDEVRRDTWRKLSGTDEGGVQADPPALVEEPVESQAARETTVVRCSAAGAISQSCAATISKKPFNVLGLPEAKGGRGRTCTTGSGEPPTAGLNRLFGLLK